MEGISKFGGFARGLTAGVPSWTERQNEKLRMAREALAAEAEAALTEKKFGLEENKYQLDLERFGLEKKYKQALMDKIYGKGKTGGGGGGIASDFFEFDPIGRLVPKKGTGKTIADAIADLNKDAGSETGGRLWDSYSPQTKKAILMYHDDAVRNGIQSGFEPFVDTYGGHENKVKLGIEDVYPDAYGNVSGPTGTDPRDAIDWDTIGSDLVTNYGEDYGAEDAIRVMSEYGVPDFIIEEEIKKIFGGK